MMTCVSHSYEQCRWVGVSHQKSIITAVHYFAYLKVHTFRSVQMHHSLPEILNTVYFCPVYQTVTGMFLTRIDDARGFGKEKQKKVYETERQKRDMQNYSQ